MRTGETTTMISMRAGGATRRVSMRPTHATARTTMWLTGLIVSTLVVVASSTAARSETGAPKDATEATRAANRAAGSALPMSDTRSFEGAHRGLVEAFGDRVITGADNRPVWSLRGYEFLGQESAPDTVHPGLWRHARVNMANGLFKVTDRVYQVRGLDLSNMTIVEGDTGLIVVDSLVTAETAKAAMELYFQHRPRRPVVAMIYSHSHADHFGGARGVVGAEEVAAGRVQVIAPAGFLEEVEGETLIAGNAMVRRAQYQFGAVLPRGPKGQVDAGLGKALSAVPFATVTLIPPTRLITRPVETHRLDGVDIVFELTPGAEA